jgi:hypothetical protein
MIEIERNPDILIDKEPVPAGMQIVEGLHLMAVPRALKIPFGVAMRYTLTPLGKTRRSTIGLVIRDEHVDAIRAGIVALANKKKYYTTTTK